VDAIIARAAVIYAAEGLPDPRAVSIKLWVLGLAVGAGVLAVGRLPRLKRRPIVSLLGISM
jgi:hypothetical protein